MQVGLGMCVRKSERQLKNTFITFKMSLKFHIHTATYSAFNLAWRRRLSSLRRGAAVRPPLTVRLSALSLTVSKWLPLSIKNFLAHTQTHKHISYISQTIATTSLAMTTSTLASADCASPKSSGNISESSNITTINIISIIAITFALANGISVHFAFISLHSVQFTEQHVRSHLRIFLFVCMRRSPLCMYGRLARGFVTAATHLVIAIIVIINWVTFQWWMASQKQCSQSSVYPSPSATVLKIAIGAWRLHKYEKSDWDLQGVSSLQLMIILYFLYIIYVHVCIYPLHIVQVSVYIISVF